LHIRVRLTLVFACLMTVLLLAIGATLYVRVGQALDHTLQESLEGRAAELRQLVRSGSSVEGTVLPDDQDDQFVQVLDPQGTVVDATPPARQRAVMTPEQIAQIDGSDPVFADRRDLGGVTGPIKIVALRIDAPQRPRILVSGVSLRDREATLSRLLTELLIGGPVALLLVSLLGYWLASAALRPVESMRAEAAAISAAVPGRRLTLPGPQDEIRRLGETFNRTLERLEAALRLERTFVADASHEMRSPVARLRTELELALRHPRQAAELEEAIRSASVEAGLLAQLTDNLLLLARSDDGELPLRLAPVDGGTLLQEVATRFEDEAARTNRRLVVEPAGPAKIIADRSQLHQALGNAVENALRHGAGTVTLRVVPNGEVVELHVTDRGEGFPEEFLPRAFIRFTRADDARTSGGTGLGLAIIQAIAAAHGGEAHAANREDGADVWLSIPAGGPQQD
jgi:signal transduction histidine kinase